MVQKIIEQLRIARLTQRVTLEELASKSKVSVKHISNIENYKTVPTIETLQKLANGLGLEIDFKISDSHQQASGQ